MDLNDFVIQSNPHMQAVVEELEEVVRATLINAGMEAEQFLSSALGKTLIESAAEDLHKSREELEGLVKKSLNDSELSAEFKRIMFRNMVIKTALNWLVIAIRTGKNSIPATDFYNEEEFI